jgi:GT2 family glycosyltransferase
MTFERPCVSVVIVTYESAVHIAGCLDSLRATASGWLADCRVVDNDSHDGTAELVAQQADWVKLLQNPENRGFGRAVNLAARDASGELLLILNPDTVIQPQAVEELVRFLDHCTPAAAAGPRLVSPHGAFQFTSRRGFPTPLNSLAYLTGVDRLFPHSQTLGGYYRRDLPPEREAATDSLSGACMMVRTDCFRSVSGFDEDYFLYGEDIDLCWKLKKAGHEIWYVPSATVVHVKGASMRRARRVARREFYRSMELFIGKRLTAQYPRAVLWATKLGVRVASALARRPLA